ncbi:DUF1254 domain-containing protein [Prescottella subtropica]|uniref:DUF1254 domain-containing protein n=1 Tax=Prescottella subtropica TaxID=2545757 RepID=UPI0010F5165D|nr:DUF1254 domain-containing protein [Prescottella subtropica]
MTHPSGDSDVGTDSVEGAESLVGARVYDLGVGPMMLDVPDVSDDDIVVRCADAWTDDVTYLDRHVRRRYVLVPPGWPGVLPADAVAVHCSTRIVSIMKAAS